MKSLLTLLFLCIPTFGQGQDVIQANKPWFVTYNHEEILPFRLYEVSGTNSATGVFVVTNAVLIKVAMVSNLVISTNGTLLSFKAEYEPLVRGQYRVAGKVGDSATAGGESDFSNYRDVRAKPNAPFIKQASN